MRRVRHSPQVQNLRGQQKAQQSCQVSPSACLENQNECRKTQNELQYWHFNKDRAVNWIVSPQIPNLDPYPPDLSLSAMWGHSKRAACDKPGREPSPGTTSQRTLIWDLQPLELWANMSVAQAAQPVVISLWQLSSITRQVQTVLGWASQNLRQLRKCPSLGLHNFLFILLT